MKINAPCITTSRLLPGIRVADCTISIDRIGWTEDNRNRFRVFIDGPGIEHVSDDQASGVGGGTLQEGLRAALSFLGACGESVTWADRHPGHGGRNADLYPREVGEWAADHQDDLTMAAIELEETPNAIEE